MKRSLPLTLPAVGSTYPFDIDGVTDLRTVESIDLNRGLMFLTSKDHPVRPTFINDVVRMVRPNDAAAWLPVLREHYSMDSEGRAALIEEANPPTVEEDLAWVDSLECGDYSHMTVCHNGEDLARAFPSLTSAVKESLRRDLYATIGDPVPALVPPRQENEQSPTRSETEAPTEYMSRTCVEATKESESPPAVSPAKPHVYKTSDRVKVARRVERDSTGHWCFWTTEMDATIGCVGEVLATVPNETAGAYLYIRVGGGEFYYSPESLEPADQTVQTERRTFKLGDKVRIARKVEVDSAGVDCDWIVDMDALLGKEGIVVQGVTSPHLVRVKTTQVVQWEYSPEALDLIKAAAE